MQKHKAAGKVGKVQRRTPVMTRLQQAGQLFRKLGYYTSEYEAMDIQFLHVWHLKKHIGIVKAKEILEANHLRRFQIKLHSELGVRITDVL